MKAVIQRVERAAVAIDGVTISEIAKGLLILLGVAEGDDSAVCDAVAAKTAKMRIFEDDGGKLNLSVGDINGELLVVSNFTLCADARKGNRPDFFGAAKPDVAEPIYERFCAKLAETVGADRVKTGSFGADMKLSLVNDGPVTIVLDSEALAAPKRAVDR